MPYSYRMRCMLAAIAAALLSRSAAAQSSMGPGIDSVFAEWRSATSPGCVVGVKRAGASAQYGSYGMANLELGVPLDTSIRLATASVAKPITALVIGTLIDEGKLALDADVRALLPEIAHYPGPITVRELLTHTSGVRDFRQLLAMSGWRSEDLIEPSDVWRVLSRQKTTSFAPGAEYTYSNSDFFLLAEIAHRILKRPFAEIARERVFAPLGMNSSVFLDWVGELVEHRASGYGHQERGWRNLHRYENIPGPGDMFTTVPDLLRFLSNLDSARVGSQTFVTLMQTPTRLIDGRVLDVEHSGDNQGLGFSLSTFAGRKTVSHDGGTPGFLANATWIPAEHLAVVTMCNTWALDLPAVTRGVLSHVLDTASRSSLTSSSTSSSRPDEYVDAAPGVYQSPTMRYLYRIHVDRDSMRIGRRSLVKRVDGRYDLPDAAGTYVAFRRDAAGKTTLLLWNPGQNSPEEYLQRRAGATPDSLTKAQLAEYVGRWYSSELDYPWEFRVDGNRLALVGQKWDADPEFYVSRDHDVFTGESGTIVEFARGSDGRLTGFRATWDRARGVAFVRACQPGTPASLCEGTGRPGAKATH